MTTNPYQHAAFAMPHMMGKAPNGANVVPGLPATMLPKALVGIGLASKLLGATKTNLGTKPVFVPVAGQPSMQVIKTPDGVATRLRRNSQYADYIGRDELLDFNRIINKIVNDAEDMSQGTLSYSDLRKRNHPYGRGFLAPSGGRRRGLGRLQGVRAGISNKAIANRHSGDFARSWKGSLSLDKSGATIELTNDSPYAPYLAFGTAKMQAHGPFTAAVVKNLPALNQEWLKVSRAAFMRQQQMEKMERADKQADGGGIDG